jgi:hypothetical protein
MTNDLHIGARVSWPVCRYTLGRRRPVTCTGTVHSFGKADWVWVLRDGHAAPEVVDGALLTVVVSEKEVSR